MALKPRETGNGDENGGDIETQPGFVPDHEREDLIIKYDGFTPQHPTNQPPWHDWRERDDLSQKRIKDGGAEPPEFPAFTAPPKGELIIKPDGFTIEEWPSENPPWHEGGRPHPQPDRIREPEEEAPDFVPGSQTDAQVEAAEDRAKESGPGPARRRRR